MALVRERGAAAPFSAALAGAVSALAFAGRVLRCGAGAASVAAAAGVVRRAWPLLAAFGLSEAVVAGAAARRADTGRLALAAGSGVGGWA